MAKNTKTTAVAVAETKTADVRRFEITSDVTAWAAGLGIELGGTQTDLADRAAEHMNRSQRHMLASGLLLAALKESCQHGEFMTLIQERGFEERNARRAMQYAEFIYSRPEAERELLIGLPKSKVLALAGADAEVIEAVLADGGEHLEGLSVRALMEELREAKAGAVDLATQRDAAEAEIEALNQKLAKRGERADKVPHVVAELRAEIAAQHKTAELAVGAFHSLGLDLVSLGGAGALDWKDGTVRLAVAALSALRLQVEGMLQMYLRELPKGDDAAPTASSSFTPQEASEAAERFATLVAVHEYERDLRKWEREQAQPRGKGRPSVAPKAPKGAK